eukprot:GHVU01175039.1.p1 GENE.GHVU01175039.1~~GHVU01175039.1.p1  ORF type:complete len:145 (+),score=14.59 GHVU01175039.1:107-541(+)
MSLYPYYFGGNAGIAIRVNGSSQSAAVVSGIAGLVRSKFPNLTAKQVKKVLISSCKVTPDLFDKTTCGGVIDASLALAAAALCDYHADYCEDITQITENPEMFHGILGKLKLKYDNDFINLVQDLLCLKTSLKGNLSIGNLCPT